MSVVLKAENISKVFKLGDVGSATLTEDIRSAWYRIRGKANPYHLQASENDRLTSGSASDYVWAVKDINFELKQGEILGIIGRNGAGKSTLLKILSRTTSPTTGTIGIKGKVASLLEVGTGFHPDLSGRENIFLNGAILGMRKAEIKAKFDEIVTFAGVERYIDTPVKRYSSGMYIRLAFAVAAHLDPDILIIDEVLAVGDSEFQNKCIGKMKDVSQAGRTVLFVSHNMGAVSDLCTRAILLNKGKLVLDAPVDIAIKEYVQQNMQIKLGDKASLTDSTVRRGNGEVRYSEIKVLNSKGEESNNFCQFDPVVIKLKAEIKKPVNELMSSFVLRSGRTRDIVTSTKRNAIDVRGKKPGDIIELTYIFPRINLRPGVYETYYWLGNRELETAFDVVDNLMPPLIINLPENSTEVLTAGYFDEQFTFEQISG